MEEIEKVCFKIGEVAEMFNVNESLLRYWEKQFDEINPIKNAKGDRLFTKKDIEVIRTIHYLTKVKGMTLKGTHAALKNNLEGEEKKAQIISGLQRIKDFLLEIKGEL
ncbi:MAG: MerR family transcriptional regulator [Bacteroidales bacterium]|nr:MerR family transcriptional regulator [Bacteroidales bacterium]